MPTSSGKSEGGRKAPSRKTKVLISPMDSSGFFIDEMRAIVTREGFKLNQDVSFPINLKKTSIDGSPSVAGGCAVDIDLDFVKQLRSLGSQPVPYQRQTDDEEGVRWEPIEEAFDRLVSRITEMGSYGIKYAFLDDEKVATRFLNQLRSQATQEQRVQMEAMSEGVMRSDLAMEGDRVYG
jgi:hypothetical protein